ncbi:hypothetical protein F2Q68_00024657 [Brassica cretica]|uniref:Uncharacterized protein n=1 Tax=Brassica cretica TaxID=69181 RepID=A0A8S9IDN9_BRACR|nr:hypothetical protein F2Q68_00024657 [Brassica cretica]
MRATWTSRSEHVAPGIETRATSRGRCETSLPERLSSSGHRKCERLGPVALITSLQRQKRERPHVVAARRRSQGDSRAPDTENASDLEQSL